jgi:hypothetical protein
MQACYTVSSAGPHEITVLAGSGGQWAPVAGSPFRTEVAPGPVHPGSCCLAGPGLAAVQLGRDMPLAVHLADRFGNVVGHADRLEAIGLQAWILLDPVHSLLYSPSAATTPATAPDCERGVCRQGPHVCMLLSAAEGCAQPMPACCRGVACQPAFAGWRT